MKRSVKMLLLLVVLAVFVGGYMGIQQMNRTQTVSEEAGTFDLTARTADDVTGLEWTTGDVTFSFVKNEGTWQKADETTFPVSQDALSDMAEELLAVQASRKLEDVTSPADYGLTEPAFTVKATWADGTSTTFIMGDETPFADGYYLQLSDQEGVAYTIGTKLSSIFDAEMTDLAVKEIIPTAENVTRLTVGSTLDVTCSETSLTINPDQHWYDADGNALDGVEELVEAAQAIAWSELADASATAEELTAYGLDNATVITLYDGETAAVTLHIGSTNDEGDYFARLPESAMVYTVDAADLSDLLSATAADLRSTTILALPYDQVQAATVSAGSVVYAIVPAQADATVATATDAEDPAEALWTALIALSATEELDAAVEKAAVLTVEVTSVSGVTAGLTITEYDADSYQLVMGERAALVSADTVDKLVRQLKQIAQ